MSDHIMSHEKQKIFAIIGAGPKGIASAVKAAVLQEFGFVTDHILLIEKNAIAANWSGEFGCTNGEMPLGTSPEKDVVFPIETDVGDAALNAQIRQRLLHFTWTSFLVHTNRYSDWVDRNRPMPCHRLWACYLQWVITQLPSSVSILYAEVTQIDLTEDGRRWVLTMQTMQHDKIRLLEVDRLMLTGPGGAKIDFINHDLHISPPTLYDMQSFWRAIRGKKVLTSGRLAIVGAGEQAASALFELSQYTPKLQIDIISPSGFITMRAESYHDNKMYSQPEKHGWQDLTLTDRLSFIKRTDLGVFSMRAMDMLSDIVQYHVIPGRVVALQYHEQSFRLNIAYHDKMSNRVYDQVILATGFNRIAMLQSLFTSFAQQTIRTALAAPLTEKVLAEKIDTTLAVQGLRPYLHLPMLAYLMQGPGFANLSCLGHLSDRVVTAFSHQAAHAVYQHNYPFLCEA